MYYTLYFMRWLVLSYSLPSKPSSSSRVTLWRRLQRLGALPVTGVYVLPERPECLESFTWLAQEIRAAEGEALVMAVERFEGLGERELIGRFNEARADAYADLFSALETLERSLKVGSDGLGSDDLENDGLENDGPPLKTLDKLRRRFAELKRTDFFDSPAGKEVMAKLSELEQILSPGLAESAQVTPVDPAEYERKIWVTRPRPHVDRLASAWLIKHFIDPEATILYRDWAKQREVSFDMDGAVFGHTGSLCTFETLLAAFALKDKALVPIAHIVHEMDLRDERYVRAEVAGLDALLDGWLASGLSDEELEARGEQLFSGLYVTFSKASEA